ncbi:hypothetical protein GJ699_18815 [Duganella sp. FT80W]|uniref:Uncharacterized protein n=1 Tax=Duganella guangzhouensis TaxID=2666084 RepID=A0A6I2L2W6_9BURK|nr:hypothetical protein [Duganella guangzhouensis]MRW92050.1 hypothetical protein [Duganella guangzhouensis]
MPKTAIQRGAVALLILDVGPKEEMRMFVWFKSKTSAEQKTTVPVTTLEKFVRLEMHFVTILSIVGSTVAMAGFAWQKQWLPSLIFAFSLSHTIFDKVFPVFLPEHLVTGFSVISLALTMIFCWQTFYRKRVT